MGLSIVIPTWNETHWLPRLLMQLNTATDVDEIFVVDNNSLDGTRAIAERFGCAVLPGGRPGTARNIGAARSTSDFIVFLDADVLIPAGTLAEVVQSFTDPGVVAVHCRSQPMTDSHFVRCCYAVMDYYFNCLGRVDLPQGVGSFIAVRADAHRAISGFNSTLSAGEDADYLRRIRKIGKVVYLRECSIHVSARRFKIEQPLWFAVKCAFWSILRLCGSKSSVLAYKWREYPKWIAEQELSWIRKQGLAQCQGGSYIA